MKQFVIRLLVVLTPILSILIFVNYFGDAANLFSDTNEKKIASEILKGNNVTNIYNCNERLLQKYLVKNSILCPEIIVVGSSRVMQINSNYFKEKSLFNSGVSSACFEDLCSIIQLYDKKKCFPKTIIIGLDPWTLNANNRESRWKGVFELEYKHFLSLMPNNLSREKEHNAVEMSKKFIAKNSYYKEIISPTYFRTSCLKLFSKNSEPYATTKRENETLTKLSDGSLTYGLKERSASREEINKKIMDYMNGTDGSITRISNYERLDTNLQSKLEFLTNYLLSKNIKVEFFLSPFHPIVYNFITKTEKYEQVLKSEKYFVDLGKKYDLKIIGSFDPSKLNMNDSYFNDGIHCNEKGLEKILTSNLP